MKIFKVRISDIISFRRLDVSFYMNRPILPSLVSLSSYVNIKGGKRIPKGDSFAFEKTDYLYLRLSDITNMDSIDYDNLKCINEGLYHKLHRYEVTENDIIISIAGTIGKCFTLKNIPHNKHIILTENCACLRLRDNAKGKILPDYILILLKTSFVQKQIYAHKIQTTIPKIGLDRIGRLEVIFPSIDTQQKIVDLYTAAQNAKLQKDKEAKELLESIDNYLLEALSINPSQEVSSESVFTKKISEMIGNRLDVSFYKDRFEMVSGIYPNKRLSSIVDIDPTIRFTGLADDTPISFIPMECIDDTFGEVKEQRKTTIAKTKGYTKFEENDLLWAKITPCMQNGKSAIARNLTNGVGCESTEYYVIRPKTDDLIIDYVYLVLRHYAVLKAAQNSFGGSAGQQRVSSQYVKSIVIPHPPIDVQKSIIATVIQKKERAKQLQSEGSKVLAEAKATIEKMILG